MLFCTQRSKVGIGVIEQDIEMSMWREYEGQEQIFLEQVCVSLATPHYPDPLTTHAVVMELCIPWTNPKCDPSADVSRRLHS